MKDYDRKLREALGIFNSDEELQEAVHALNSLGFDRYKLSVIGSESAMKKSFNEIYKNPEELMDDPKTPRGTNISPEEVGVGEGVVMGSSILAGVVTAIAASGGVLIPAVIPATVIGITAGAAFGAIAAKLIGDTHGAHLQKQIEAGGLLLWVRVEDEKEEEMALDILKTYGAHHIHVHELLREEA